jgi:hypothetical protein
VNTRDGRTYQFRIVGHVDDRWTAWFSGLSIACHPDGTCTLTGQVADQAQLHGILARVRDMGATLLSLRTADGDEQVTVRSGAPVRDLGAPQRDGC